MQTKKTKSLLNKIIAEKRKYWERYRYLIQETFKTQMDMIRKNFSILYYSENIEPRKDKTLDL